MTQVETRTDDAKKVDGAIGDAKKLALRCKTLEMQLRQSVPKKEHHEITSKLEKQIDFLEKELDRAREANAKTVAINKQISGVEDLISSLIKTANAQVKTLDSIEEDGAVRGKALTTQGKTLDALAAKISQGTVPSQVYLQALSKVDRLEEEKRGMVRRFDYNSLESRCEELSRQLGTMVPAADHAALKEKFDEAARQVAEMVPVSDYMALKQRVEELEGAMYTMVPREKYVSGQQRVAELEARLAEHVPQSVYDELVAKVMSLAEAVSGGGVQAEEAQTEQTAEVASPAASEGVEAPVAEAAADAVAEAPAPEPQAELVISEAPAPQPEIEVAVAEAPAAQDAPAEALAAVQEAAPVVEVTAPIEQTPAVSPEQAAPQEPASQIAPEVTAAPSSETAAETAPEAVPEVREIQSQLAELSAQSQETHDAVVPAQTGTADAKPAEQPVAEATQEVVVASSGGSEGSA